MKSAGRVIAGLVALWMLVPQVGADEPTPTTEQKAPDAVEPVAAPETETAVAAEPADAATKEAAASKSATVAAASDPVICKRFEATGSRLRKGKVCRKKSEWDQQEVRADEIVKGIEKNSSVGVGDL